MNLETDRLIIRSLSVEDSNAYAKLVRDADVMRYLGGPLSTEAAHRYVMDCVQRDQTNGISRYAVVEKTSGTFIGFCGFKQLREDAGQQVSAGTSWIDFGWRYQQQVWRQGYGIEAAEAVYAYGKNSLCLTGVEARAHRDNLGSLRIIEKLGFVWVNDYSTHAGPFRRYREPN